MKYSRLLLGLASLSAFAACEGEEIVKAVNDNEIAINNVDAIENVVESIVDPIVEEAAVSVETPEMSDGKVEMVFACGDPNSSLQKTYLAGAELKNIFFSKDDKISVWDGTSMCEFTAQTYGAKTTTFKGSAKEALAYPIIYPYMPAGKVTYKDGKFTTDIPHEQTAVENSFDPKAAISVSKYYDGDDFFLLKNVTTVFKVTPLEDFSKIELRALGGEAIAGKVDIDPVYGESSIVGGYAKVSSIFLKPAAGEKIKANTMYCINVFPQEYLGGGLALYFYDENGNYKRQKLSTITSIKRNKTQVITSTTNYDGYYLANGTPINFSVDFSVSDANLQVVDPAGKYVDITISTNVDLIVKFPSWIEFPVSEVPANTSNETFRAYIKPNYGTTSRNGYMTFALKPFPDRGIQKTVIQKMDNAYPGLGDGDPIGTPKN